MLSLPLHTLKAWLMMEEKSNAELSKFLEQIKNKIDPQAHTVLVQSIKRRSLNPDPFSEGLAWRNTIKNTSAFQN